MPVSKMEKLTVVVQHQRVDALLEQMMRLHCVDMIDMRGEPTELGDYGDRADVASAMAEAERVDAVLPALYAHAPHKRRIFRALPRVKHADFMIDGRMERALQHVQEAECIIEEKKALIAERDQKIADMKTYTPFLGWEKPLDFDGTSSTTVILGVFPGKTSRTTVVQTITDRAAMVRIISEDVKGLYVAIMVHRDEREATMRSLAKIGFMAVMLPRVKATPKTLFDQADRERAEIEVKLARLDRRLAVIAEHTRDVEILSDIAHTALAAEKLKHRLGSTASCAVFAAWIPADEKEKVASVLENLDVAYEFEGALTSDKPPVRLANSRVVKPFEDLVGTRAYPVYGKFEPTLVLSLLFCLVFGLMYADVIYGLMMAIPAFVLISIFRLPRGLKKFLFVLGCSGLFAAVFGGLFGVYLGGIIPRVTFIPAPVLVALDAIRPMQRPIVAVAFTFVLGALHVAVGQVLAMISLFRQKLAKKALLDVAPYLLLSLSAIFQALSLVFFKKLWFVGLIAIGASLLVILLTQGLQEKGAKGKLNGALWGIGGLGKYVGMFFTYTQVFVLAVVAVLPGVLGYFVPKFGNFPLVPLVTMLLVFLGAYLACMGVNKLLAKVRAKGLKYVDFAGNFYREANPAFDPITPVGRFAEDVSPADSNSF